MKEKTNNTETLFRLSKMVCIPKCRIVRGIPYCNWVCYKTLADMENNFNPKEFKMEQPQVDKLVQHIKKEV